MTEAACERARTEQTTLNEQFRRWLADYARQGQQTESAMALIEDLRGQVRTGVRKFTRDEMNERWIYRYQYFHLSVRRNKRNIAEQLIQSALETRSACISHQAVQRTLKCVLVSI